MKGYGKERKNLSNIQRDKQSAATIVARGAHCRLALLVRRESRHGVSARHIELHSDKEGGDTRS
jgi:hypothetical protein